MYMYVSEQALGQWMICFSTSHAYNIACVYFYSIQVLVPVALSMYYTFGQFYMYVLSIIMFMIAHAVFGILQP